MLPTKFSSNVAISLIVAGKRLNVAQVTAGEIHLRDSAVDAPAGEATLILEIDGELTKETVILPYGFSRGQRKVAFF
ncbi:hypothetical protein [Aporhodopirellula aestuarii]|uniref:Uncharacterized protein n=1 Tax=Aporhodopirellula aestuarii TaxID=2950107 RepID=A0ABT0U4Q7_9BACT|nr:hypothetical protein [Aporhodopirellula aestuarii]MCM2371911.1 hypothetical protein [Aporhodopirellula aestuarii]